MVFLYKARVLSYIEYRTSALYHASDTLLQKVNQIQRSFMRQLGLTPSDALLKFNLAPLETRRDIAMLGLIHRAALGQGPSQLQSFFKKSNAVRRDVTRADKRRHSQQLDDPRRPDSTEFFRRSAWGLIAVYNLLPEEIVSTSSVP